MKKSLNWGNASESFFPDDRLYPHRRLSTPQVLLEIRLPCKRWILWCADYSPQQSRGSNSRKPRAPEATLKAATTAPTREANIIKHIRQQNGSISLCIPNYKERPNLMQHMWKQREGLEPARLGERPGIYHEVSSSAIHWGHNCSSPPHHRCNWSVLSGHILAVNLWGEKYIVLPLCKSLSLLGFALRLTPRRWALGMT